MAVGELTYHRPSSLAEACQLARSLEGEAAFLAGGTELLPDFEQGRDSTGHLIALDRVPGLSEIRRDDDDLSLGALVTLADITTSPTVRDVFLPLAEAARTVGGEQIRNLATIGGNFCRAVPCADTPPICIAAGATVTITDGDRSRSLPAEDFFTGPRETVLERGELVSEIRIPSPLPGSGASYQRFSRRKGSALAVASVATALTLRDGAITNARVVLGAVAPVPLLVHECTQLLSGRPPSNTLFASAGRAAAKAARPITDLRGTAEFRRELVDVLTRRALRQAIERAGGEI
jgi:carbon-monoxide dehydrogenase medium subunit